MAQTPAGAKPQANAKPPAAGAPQARLILQDPMAFDQATQPALRSSVELSAEPAAAGLEREKARDLWESLSLEPEVAQERISERKRLLQRAENSARELAAAKTQALELQAQLAKARDDRLNHPLVYAGAAGLLGFGALWFLERRKRMASQERELEALANQNPSLRSRAADLPHARAQTSSPDELHSYLPQQGMAYSLEDSPDLAHDFATDLKGLPDTGRIDTAPQELIPAPATQTSLAVPQEPEWARAKSQSADQQAREQEQMLDTPLQKQDKGLLSMSKRVLGNMLRRRSEQDAAYSAHVSSAAHASTHASTAAPSTLFHEQADHATQMLYDEEAQEAFEQELLAQQLSAGLHAGYQPDEVHQNTSSPILMTAPRSESAMEHLLELRTAVNGLCALGRQDAATKMLEDFIATDPDTCSWVYLEYMHVCEQKGWRDPFEVMRKRYRQQFNRMAPYWHEPNANVLGLDGYARAASELCTAWAQGAAHAHTTLATWLAGPMLGRKLVQLPAYHDLFDLYEMLEFLDASDGTARTPITAERSRIATSSMDELLLSGFPAHAGSADLADESEFVPTVSLLDLDYEFSSDVTLQAKEVLQSEQAVTIVKPGNFSVDFNVAGTQMGAMPSMSAALPKK